MSITMAVDLSTVLTCRQESTLKMYSKKEGRKVRSRYARKLIQDLTKSFIPYVLIHYHTGAIINPEHKQAL